MAFAKYVTFSFDDAPPQDEKLVQIFNYYGLKCTFNINSGVIPECYEKGNRISKDRARDVYLGHEVASHGRFHPKYANLSKEEQEEDISFDLKELERVMGYRIRGHAYPYNSYNCDTVEILKKYGIEYARTTGESERSAGISRPLELCPTCHHGHDRIFDIIEMLKNTEPEDSDILLYIWGHSYELDFDDELCNWAHMEKLCKTISKISDFKPVTNIEFFDLTKK